MRKKDKNTASNFSQEVVNHHDTNFFIASKERLINSNLTREEFHSIFFKKIFKENQNLITHNKKYFNKEAFKKHSKLIERNNFSYFRAFLSKLKMENISMSKDIVSDAKAFRTTLNHKLKVHHDV